MAITASDIRVISGSATDRIVAGIVAGQGAIADGGIDTPLRLCHFLAQLAHESAHFQVTREFASGEAYEGRQDLGNAQPGDGRRYRGRGLIQTTGRTNYREASDDIRAMIPDAPDFEADPVALEEFPWALLSGISYWRRRNLNRHADRDDVRAVTRAINGGLNGLDDRIKYLRRTKQIWLGGAPGNPLLQRGDRARTSSISRTSSSRPASTCWSTATSARTPKRRCRPFSGVRGWRSTAGSARAPGPPCATAKAVRIRARPPPRA